MLGVARVIGNSNGKNGELSVLVGDLWQGQGIIGSYMLEKCLSIARQQGLQAVYAIVLRENRSMLALGKKLGFELKESPEPEKANWLFILKDQETDAFHIEFSQFGRNRLTIHSLTTGLRS